MLFFAAINYFGLITKIELSSSLVPNIDNIDNQLDATITVY